MTSEGLQNIEAHSKEYTEARAFLRELIVSNDKEKMEDLYSQIRSFAPIVEVDPEDLIGKLKEIRRSASPEEFVTQAFNLLKKFVDMKIEHPERMEDIRRERVIQNAGNIRLSELMHYDVNLEDGVARVHIAPKGSLSLGGVLKSFRDGMNELARQVNEDKRIQEIQATSWIVASNPGLLERSGFIIEGPIDEKTRTEHFTDETRPISRAHMSREELLKRYLPTHQ